MNRDSQDQRPWYKEPWPWVIIAIPAAAVVAGMYTLYLAISNPDYLVIEEDEYREVKSELRAQSQADSQAASKLESELRDDTDGAN
jgi:hypothetical protein